MYGCCHITPDLIRNSALKALYLFQPKFPPRAERGTGEAGGRDHPHPRPPHPWFCLPPLVSSPSVGNWLSKDQPRAGSGLGLGSTSGLGTLTPRAAALPPPPSPPAICLAALCHGGPAPSPAGERSATGAGLRPGRGVSATGRCRRSDRAEGRQRGGGAVSEGGRGWVGGVAAGIKKGPRHFDNFSSYSGDGLCRAAVGLPLLVKRNSSLVLSTTAASAAFLGEPT